jgi:aryl-alcohol dehydrogenase-like predicted oxidoreductase
MDRRDFLKKGTAAAGLAAAHPALAPLARAVEGEFPKRALGKTGVELSIIGFGGIVVTDTPQSFANHIVAESYDLGINYFDVAPSYGNAEERLGPALEPYRKKVFLACKTQKRDKAGAEEELHASLKRLRTDHFDLYQLHALTTMEDLDRALAPGGAMETFLAARKAGKVRFLGFSAHSVETALAAIERFDFDTILFPFNYVMFSQATFGPQVMERARQKGMGLLALKAMAKTHWPETMKQEERPFPKCWYEPAALEEEAALALRWTLSLPVTAAVPPGDEKYYRLALEVAGRFSPLKPEEEKTLLARAQGVAPLFRLGNAGGEARRIPSGTAPRSA